MQYLTLTTSLKKLHTLKELKYSQSLFDQSSFESFEAISGHLTQSSPIHAIPLTNRPNPIQSVSNSGVSVCFPVFIGAFLCTAEILQHTHATADVISWLDGRFVTRIYCDRSL